MTKLFLRATALLLVLECSALGAPATAASSPAPAFPATSPIPQSTQTAPAAKAKSRELPERYLGGHLYLRSKVSTFPFLVPYSEISVSGASLKTANPVADTSQPILNSLSFNPAIEFSSKTWGMGWDVGIGSYINVGADSYSALVIGGNVAFILSTKLRTYLIKRNSWVVTPYLGGFYQVGIGFSPAEAVEKLILSPEQATSASFAARQAAMQATAGFAFAYTLNNSFGLLGDLGALYTRSIRDNSASNLAEARTSLSLSTSFNRALGIPLGTLITVQQDFVLNRSAHHLPMLELGLFETKKIDSTFGVIGTMELSDPMSWGVRAQLISYY